MSIERAYLDMRYGYRTTVMLMFSVMSTKHGSPLKPQISIATNSSSSAKRNEKSSSVDIGSGLTVAQDARQVSSSSTVLFSLKCIESWSNGVMGPSTQSSRPTLGKPNPPVTNESSGGRELLSSQPPIYTSTIGADIPWHDIWRWSSGNVGGGHCRV